MLCNAHFWISGTVYHFNLVHQIEKSMQFMWFIDKKDCLSAFLVMLILILCFSFKDACHFDDRAIRRVPHLAGRSWVGICIQYSGRYACKIYANWNKYKICVQYFGMYACKKKKDISKVRTVSKKMQNACFSFWGNGLRICLHSLCYACMIKLHVLSTNVCQKLTY